MKTDHKIVLVEDDPLISDLLIQKLQNEGLNLDYAANGKSAIEKIDKDTSLVVLDLRLPDIDGFEVLKHIRENADTKDIPVIVFSNFSEESYQQRAKELGANELILKVSLSLDEVAKRIKKYLE